MQRRRGKPLRPIRKPRPKPESVCIPHKCDHCAQCQSGTCCRTDVGQADLPAQGSWSGETYAPLGELVEKNGKIICHICGHGVIALTRHLLHKHPGVTADKYRAYFGLACGRSLVTKAEFERRSAAATAARLHTYMNGGAGPIPPRPTPEQMSELAYRREARIEVQAKNKTRLRKGGRFARPRNIRWGKVNAKRPRLEGE